MKSVVGEQKSSFSNTTSSLLLLLLSSFVSVASMACL